MIPRKWWTGPEPEPTRQPEEPAASRRTGGLTDAQRDLLANALHERWHGHHTPERGKTECARAAGCYDDIDALEPVILDLMRGAS